MPMCVLGTAPIPWLAALDRSEDEISVGEINLHLDTARYMAAVHYRSVEEELAGDREHRQEICA